MGTRVEFITNQEALQRRYSNIANRYEQLRANLSRSLETLIESSGIEVFEITSRLKTIESFQDKAQRKGYKNPFKEIEDICGLRIICYYPSDLMKISRIIHREFKVIEAVDRIQPSDVDRFGYRSFHFIVSLKPSWLKVPEYRDLSSLRAEIQARTILMHAWAGVEHKLAYKNKEFTPQQFRRKLSQLSALFELADEHFDSLQREKKDYQRGLAFKDKRHLKTALKQPLNVDTLQALLDSVFPNRRATNHLLILSQMKTLKLTLADLYEALEKTKTILPKVELEILGQGRTGSRGWFQEAAARVTMALTNDAYWKKYWHAAPRESTPIQNKWRKWLKAQLKDGKRKRAR